MVFLVELGGGGGMGGAGGGWENISGVRNWVIGHVDPPLVRCEESEGRERWEMGIGGCCAREMGLGSWRPWWEREGEVKR